MKTILLATLLATAVFNTASAQTAVAAETPATAAAKTMTKAEKEAAKAKKEADLLEAFTKAGVTADEQLKYKAAVDASNEKTKPIKADASLSDADKKTKVDAIGKERNDNIKALFGEAKYKLFKATQKAQKEAAATTAG